jgi:hypothetical protein
MTLHIQPRPNVPMLDALAGWWAEQLEADKRKTIAGSDEWNDAQAKLSVIREYRQACQRITEGDAVDQMVTTRNTLGWVMRELALPYSKRPGWIHAWRQGETFGS